MNSIFSKGELASNLSDITGSSFENCFQKINNLTGPRITDIFGSLNVPEYYSLARELGAPKHSTIKGIQSLTGSGYEDTLNKICKIPLSRIDDPCDLKFSGLPSWHPLNK